MNNIIEKLEAATGPDRELDCWVQCIKDGDDFEIFRRVVPDFHQWTCPYYTASIDAAMALVPEGWTVANLGEQDDKSWWCELRKGFLTSYSTVALSNLRTPTPALAICIAALKGKP
jgi:hypothetical protein